MCGYFPRDGWYVYMQSERQWRTPLMLLLFVNPKYESSPPSSPPFYVLLKALVCAYIEERHEPLIREEGREEDGQTFNCKKSPACLKGRTTTSTTSSKRGRERETNIKLQAPMKRKSNCRTYTCKWLPPWLLTYIYVKAVDRNTRSSSSLGKENVRTWASLFIPFIPTLKACRKPLLSISYDESFNNRKSSEQMFPHAC